MKWLDVEVFWYFSMVTVLYTIDMNFSLHVMSLLSFLRVISVILTHFLCLGCCYFKFSSNFISEISLCERRSIAVVWPPLLLWGSQHWVVNDVHPQLSCFSSTFCAHFSQASCARFSQVLCDRLVIYWRT